MVETISKPVSGMQGEGLLTTQRRSHSQFGQYSRCFYRPPSLFNCVLLTGSARSVCSAEQRGLSAGALASAIVAASASAWT